MELTITHPGGVRTVHQVRVPWAHFIDVYDKIAFEAVAEAFLPPEPGVAQRTTFPHLIPDTVVVDIPRSQDYVENAVNRAQARVATRVLDKLETYRREEGYDSIADALDELCDAVGPDYTPSGATIGGGGPSVEPTIKWWYTHVVRRRIRHLYIVERGSVDIDPIVESATYFWRLGLTSFWRMIRKSPRHVLDMPLEQACRLANVLGITYTPEQVTDNNMVRFIFDYSAQHCHSHVPEKVMRQRYPKVDEVWDRITDEYEVVYSPPYEGHKVVSESVDGDEPQYQVIGARGGAYYMTRNYEAERGLADEITRLLLRVRVPNVHQEPTYGLSTITEEQKEAVCLALRSSISVISGGPGRGKTTIIKEVCRNLKAKEGKTYVLTALTGMAVARMKEVTREEASFTTHYMLAGQVSGNVGDGIDLTVGGTVDVPSIWDPRNNKDTSKAFDEIMASMGASPGIEGRKQMPWDDEVMPSPPLPRGRAQDVGEDWGDSSSLLEAWAKGDADMPPPLHGSASDVDTIILDEASMTVTWLLHAVLVKYQPKRLVLVGDAQQLQPISWGCALRQLLSYNKVVKGLVGIGDTGKDTVQVYATNPPQQGQAFPVIPAVFLKANHRTREPIMRFEAGRLVHHELCQLLPGGTDMVLQVYAGLLKAGVSHTDIAVITPYVAAVDDINAKCQALMVSRHKRPPIHVRDGRSTTLTWYVGDRVMLKKKLMIEGEETLPNGAMGRIVDIGGLDNPSPNVNKELLVEFAGRIQQVSILVESANSWMQSSRYRATTKTLKHAYAFTAHSAQGNEWPCVVFYVPNKAKSPMFFNFYLIYTALTRAKMRLYVVGDVASFHTHFGIVKDDPLENLTSMVIEAIVKTSGLTEAELGVPS